MVQPLNDMVKIAGQTVERSTLTGLQRASAKSGMSFQYLVAKAAQESSLNPEAQATTSSARGLFQFTRGTWLEMMHRYGSQYGYGDLANKIDVTDGGKTVVNDTLAERRLLALREDPEAAGLMAAAYAQDNAAALESALGRMPDAPDLYLAHFLGASGATTLLNAAQNTPDRPGAHVLPAAANANRSIFYTAEGQPRPAAEVVDLIRGRFDNQLDRFAAADLPRDAAPAAQGTPAQNAQAKARAAAVNFAHGLNRMAEKDATARKLMEMMVLEEMAKLIALRPLQMMGDEDDEALAHETSLSPLGFQGQDFAAAMMRASDDPLAQGLPKHNRGPSAYQPASPLPVNLDDLL